MTSYSTPPMVEACLHGGIITSSFHALSTEVYFRVPLHLAPRMGWTLQHLIKFLFLPPPPSLNMVYIMKSISPPPSPVPGERLLHSRYFHWAHNKTNPSTVERNYALSYRLLESNIPYKVIFLGKNSLTIVQNISQCEQR